MTPIACTINDLQIAEAIVQFVAVSVIDHNGVSQGANKSLRYQPMDIVPHNRVIPKRQRNRVVPDLQKSWLEDLA
jgi:hypothetical protein